MAWDPYNGQRWKHKVGFHNRGVQWGTPMARWAGEGNDWIKLMAHRKARKEDVIRSLLESMKQAVERNTEPNGIRPIKKPRDLPPLEIERPEAGQRRTLEIKSDCKSIVDWINGPAKMKTRASTVENTQSLLRDWWVEGSIYDIVLPYGPHTSFVNTKKLMRGLKKPRRDGWKNGWTLPMLCGPRSLVSVGFEMAVVTTAIVGSA